MVRSHLGTSSEEIANRCPLTQQFSLKPSDIVAKATSLSFLGQSRQYNLHGPSDPSLDRRSGDCVTLFGKPRSAVFNFDSGHKLIRFSNMVLPFHSVHPGGMTHSHCNQRIDN